MLCEADNILCETGHMLHDLGYYAKVTICNVKLTMFYVRVATMLCDANNMLCETYRYVM